MKPVYHLVLSKNDMIDLALNEQNNIAKGHVMATCPIKQEAYELELQDCQRYWNRQIDTAGLFDFKTGCILVQKYRVYVKNKFGPLQRNGR